MGRTLPKSEGNCGAQTNRAERGYRAGKFNRKGQGDLWLTFDKVFEVGGTNAINLLARLLDGEFGVAEPARAPAAAPPVPQERSCEGPAEAEARAQARAAIGESNYRAWLEPSSFRIEGEALTITATSAFAADWISQHISPQLRRTGRSVRVAIERVTA